MNRVILFFLILALPYASFSQSRRDLEQQRKQKEKEISVTKKILNQTKNKKLQTLSQLQTLSKQIRTREELINTVSRQVSLLDQQIQDYQSTIKTLEQDIKNLKDEYGKMIYHAYKNRNSFDRMMFVFASDNFNQAVKRIKYLQQYGDYRTHQAQLIVKTQNMLAINLRDLINARVEKQNLLVKKDVERQELETDKKEETELFNTLAEKEEDLKNELREKQEASRKLNRAIEELIEREIEEARRREEAAAAKAGKSTAPKTTSRSSSGMAMTPEAMKLSADFSSNRNRLPWPVDQGYISQHFGNHPHPTLKGIMVANNGVNITTIKGAPVKAIFNGEVAAYFRIPGMNWAIMVRHGDFFTIYANIEEVLVKKGDKITAKQVIGKASTNEEEGKTEIHLEIWKGKVKLNPEDWLKK